MSLFCKHKWELIESINIPNEVRLISTSARGCSVSELQDTHQTILTCNKCGTLKVIKTIAGVT